MPYNKQLPNLSDDAVNISFGSWVCGLAAWFCWSEVRLSRAHSHVRGQLQAALPSRLGSSDVWGPGWLCQLCPVGLLLQQASLVTIPQQKLKTGRKREMHHQVSACLTFALIPLAKINDITEPKVKRWDRVATSPPAHTHTHARVCARTHTHMHTEAEQSYIVKGSGPGRGKELSSSVSLSHIQKNLPTLIAGKEREKL